METRYGAAEWAPLGQQTEPIIGVPRILVVHTMVGNLRGTGAMFARGGYDGVESHFGIGGPWEPGNLDGHVVQWQSIDRQADAQGAGNAYCTSVETADGGNPDRAWTPKQVDALVGLVVWWCRQTGAPAKLVGGPSQRGIGYHSQFREWNPNAHTCPNPARIKLLRTLVIPAAARALTGGVSVQPESVPAAVTPKPLPPAVGRYLRPRWVPMRGEDVKSVQRRIPGAHVSGIYDRSTVARVRAWQAAHHLVDDGIVGPATVRAMGLRWVGPVSV